MADERKECKHEGCHCMASPDGDYCSAYCAGAAGGDVTELKCDCGHQGCS